MTAQRGSPHGAWPAWIAPFVLLGLLARAAPAHATVTCTGSGPTLTFGTISPYTGYPYTTSGNATLSCSNNAAAATLYVCVSIGTGSGGTTPTNRTLAAGGATLPIQITGSASSTTQIGNGNGYAMEGPYSSSAAANASGSGTVPLAVILPQPASAPSPGSYASSFSGADAQILYATPASAPATCAALAAGVHAAAQINFSVAATVPTQCTVSAGGLAFPTASVLAAPVAASSTVSVTCNASTAVTVALDNGADGTGPTARQMKSGTHAITYGIYRDQAATMPWGATAGTNTASLPSGTGTLTAYGVVPAQASPPPGSYSDVVDVTLSY